MTDAPTYLALSGSERDHLLGVCISDGSSGRSIHGTVQNLRDETFHPVATYDPLESLAERGLIKKWEQDIDGRTNSYVLTDDGRETIDSAAAIFERLDDGDGSDQ
jgi:DNA-binding PadR family transcriptional regulator